MRKVAVITGASRGIGKACAGAFAREGYNLALCCKNNMDMLQQFAAELEKENNIQVLCFQTDVASEKAVQDMMTKVFEAFPEVDVLVNNAGISKVGLMQDLSAEEWREILDVNLSSAFYFSKAVIPVMLKKQAGHIINISSVWGMVGASCEVAYSATKGGLNAMTKALAKELAPSHISVNALACGAIDTEMNMHLDASERQALEDEIPFGRMASVQEVAECVCSLAGTPTYLTGQVMAFDGGWQ